MRRLVTWLFIIASIFGMVVFYSYTVPVFKENEEFVDSEVGDNLTGAAKTAYDKNMNAYDIIVQLSERRKRKQVKSPQARRKTKRMTFSRLYDITLEM